MLSNDRQSGDRNAIVSGPMHGGVRLIAIEAIAAQIQLALAQGCKRSTIVINRTSPGLALTNWPASRAVIIFVIDTFTPLDIAIAVLYVIVVLMAANFLRRRGVILVSLACAGLTVLSFILQHEYWDSDLIGRVSLTDRRNGHSRRQ